MRYGDCWAGGGIVIIGVIAVYAAWPLEFWSEFGPGPGFMPGLLGGSLIVMGTLVSLTGLRNGHAIVTSFGNFRKPLLVAGMMLAYIALIEILGFAISTALFIFTVIRWIESRGAWLALGLAIGITSGLHLIFVTLLNTTLPLGILAWMP